MANNYANCSPAAYNAFNRNFVTADNNISGENNPRLRIINNVTSSDNNRPKRRKLTAAGDDDENTHKVIPWKKREIYSPGVVGYVVITV